MEEVDSIILHFLRQLNTNISQDIQSICELPVEIILESASKCLKEINQSIKLPSQIPSGVSHRIGIASQIASMCKDLGYKNDVGYQTFLYYNEVELRQVFMFLIENLPKEGKNISAAASDKPILYQEIGKRIEEELNKVWIPPCCDSAVIRNNNGDVYLAPASAVCNLKFTSLNEENLLAKLKNNKEYYNKPEPIKEETIEINSKEKPDNNIEISKSLKELKELVIVLRQKLDTLESERNLMDVEYSQVQKSYERVDTEMKNVVNILKSVGVHNLDDAAVENIMEKVKMNINVLHRKSEDLTSKNLTLKVELDKFNSQMDCSQSERIKCKNMLTTLKEQAKAMKDEYNKNEETKNQLKQLYDKSKGGNKRYIYTKRILEIISNVDKQNMEIMRILEDTRQLQKEINTLEGQLDRCFSIADETLFRDAKKDDQAKKAYKLLALLHSECSTIVSLVNDTGALAREMVDLEDNIKTEKEKKTEDTLKKIHIDLAKMHQESLMSV